MASVLALAASLFWGAGDFYGGVQSRSLPPLAVAIWSQAAGMPVLLLAVSVLRQPPQSAGAVWGVLGGLCGGAGLLLFYRALSEGVMSLVAPIAACGAVIPVGVSSLLGHRLSPPALGGMLAALAGVVLLSLQTRSPRALRLSGPVLLLALGAAVSFGFFFVGLERAVAADGTVVWATVAARVGSLSLLVLTAVLGRTALPWPGRRSPAVAGVGTLDTTANLLFTAATTQGSLAIVAVLGSLYPLVTVLLGRVMLSERLTTLQSGGVALALVGVILLSAG